MASSNLYAHNDACENQLLSNSMSTEFETSYCSKYTFVKKPKKVKVISYKY